MSTIDGKELKTGKTNLHYFSMARLALNMEVKHHTPLLLLLQQYNPNTQYPEILGEIAAYCNIAMDGLYTQEDLDRLCGILYRKLTEMRKIILH